MLSLAITDGPTAMATSARPKPIRSIVMASSPEMVRSSSALVVVAAVGFSWG
jgi:hypothetical protein